MAVTFLPRMQTHLRNSTPSGTECTGGQLIVFTPLPVVLCTGKPHYLPSPPFANTTVGQLPSVWSALLQNSILPLPGYLSVCPPGTRDVLLTIIAFFFKAPPKLSILLHGSAQWLILPSTCLYTPCITRFPTLLRSSLSSGSPRLTLYPCRCGGNHQ